MYKVHLENFDGPLDLLLFFIRRDEIDIYDIPISHITKEYLGTLDQMQHVNIGVAGEFIEMAATLMRIKSKMLLPRPQMDEDILARTPIPGWSTARSQENLGEYVHTHRR